MSTVATAPVRFDRIELTNYRVYREAAIDFPRRGTHDLHVIVGHGGAGKTNLMNAMSWCLYGEERYIPADMAGLPLQHQDPETFPGPQDKKVSVRLTMSRCSEQCTEDSTDLFTRTLDGGRSVFRHQKISSGELITDENNDAATRYANRLIPHRLKSYYLFDCEKIQDFLFSQAASELQPTLEFLSNIQLVQTTIDHLTSFQTGIQKEVSKNSPDVLKLISEKDTDQDELQQQRQLLDQYQQQQTEARERREAIDRELQSIEKAVELADRRSQLETRRNELRDRLSKTHAAYRAQLYQVFTDVLTRSALEMFLELVHQKEQRNELPPPVSTALIEQLLEQNVCICGRPLGDDPDAKQHLEDLLHRATAITEIATVVTPVKQSTERILGQMDYESARLLEARQALADLEEEWEMTTTELQQVSELLQGSDVARAQQLERYRQEAQELYDKYTENVATARVTIRALEKQLEDREQRIAAAEIQMQIVEEQRAKLDVVNRALSIAKNILKERQTMVVTHVSQRFDEVFHQMMWQKDLYSKALLDGGCRIHVLHANGSDALASMSESEKEATALAFIIALHEVSGFQGPLVLDFPFGRVTDKMQEYIADILKDLSRTRQLILLLTDTEFDQTQTLLGPAATTISKLVRKNNRETIVEPLS